MDVVAAVIVRNGLILICQRKSGRHALKWEFPGGKVESGEDGQTALARELREELKIEARIGELMGTEVVPGMCLRFFQVTDFTGEPVNTEFAQMLWEDPASLPDYDFLAADVEFVKKLALR